MRTSSGQRLRCRQSLPTAADEHVDARRPVGGREKQLRLRALLQLGIDRTPEDGARTVVVAKDALLDELALAGANLDERRT
jgi:hypothetical protein